MGYPSGYKGYKVLNLETNSISITRNILFREDIFPFQSSEPNVSVLDLFPSTILPLSIPDTSRPIYVSIPSTSSSLPVPSFLSDNNSVLVESDNTSEMNANRPKRNIRTPSYLANYHYNLINHITSEDSGSTAHPLSSVLDYSRFSEDYVKFICNVSSEAEPENFQEAIRDKR